MSHVLCSLFSKLKDTTLQSPLVAAGLQRKNSNWTDFAWKREPVRLLCCDFAVAKGITLLMISTWRGPNQIIFTLGYIVINLLYMCCLWSCSQNSMEEYAILAAAGLQRKNSNWTDFMSKRNLCAHVCSNQPRTPTFITKTFKTNTQFFCLPTSYKRVLSTYLALKFLRWQVFKSSCVLS